MQLRLLLHVLGLFLLTTTKIFAADATSNDMYPSEMKMQQDASERRVYKRGAHTQATSNDAASFPKGIIPNDMQKYVHKYIQGGYAWGLAEIYNNELFLSCGSQATAENEGVKNVSIRVVALDSSKKVIFKSKVYKIPDACGRNDSDCPSKDEELYKIKISKNDLKKIMDFEIEIF